MAKRVREEDLDLDRRLANLEAYVKELEWVAGNKARVRQCSVTACSRLVADDSGCDICGLGPTKCVICAPDEFSWCSWSTDCRNYFCRLHGDVKIHKCDECLDEPKE